MNVLQQALLVSSMILGNTAAIITIYGAVYKTRHRKQADKL